MKILFINPRTSRYSRSISTPLGLLSIATYLESKGHIVKIYDRLIDKTKLKDVIDNYKPDVAGVSLISYKSINDFLHVAQMLKESEIPVVAGGPLPSELVEMTLAYDCIDIVSIGEGEATWLDIVSFFAGEIKDIDSVYGIAYKNRKGEVIRTKTRDFMNLAEIPPLNWSLIDVPKYFQSSYGCDKMIYLYAAKGCPFSCTFCYNKEFHRCTYRKRPLEFLVEEIKVLVKDYGMNGVYFADELWCKNREEMHEICDILRSLNLDFVWGCQTRIGIFELEDFEYMYKSGCRWVYFGVESGSKTMLKKINKRIDYEKIEQSFSDCRKAGVACVGSFIIGLPDETREDVMETINLIRKLDTRLINYNYLAVVPGSEIYKDLITDGRYIEAENLKDFGKRNPLESLEYNFSRLPEVDIKVIRAFFMWRSFTAKDIPNDKNYGFAKKVVTDAKKSVRTGDLSNFVMATLYAAMEFIKIFFYSHFFMSVKKKYGLNTFKR
jgi:radical SAM superfamily enzyme YgiQ (UPF0313 family)